MNNDSVIQMKMKSIKGKIEKWIEKGHLKEAMEALDDYEAMVPGDLEIFSMRAVIHIINGSFEEAKAVLMDGLRKDSVHFDLLFNLAYVNEQLGQYQKAAEFYSKAVTVAYTQSQKQSVYEAIDRVRAIDEKIVIEDRARIVVFVRKGLDSFLGDIIDELSKDYWVRKIIVEDLSQIDEGMIWADVCWFEWCDDLVVYGSNLPLAKQKKIVCRLHRYEVFTDYPAKTAWENVNKLIIVTSHLKQLLEINLPDISERVEIAVIENGVDVERYKFKKRTKGFNLAMVGYIHTRKNPGLVLQVIEKLVKQDKRYKLYIAGQFQESVIELYWNYQVERMGLADNVIFEGWQNDINQWLENKNYLVSTSIHESFGYGIAEAMARGIKPIVHDFLYANDIWDDEFLFSSVDEAVDSITNGKYESEKYRAFIENNYSLEKQMTKIKALMAEQLSFRIVIEKADDIINGRLMPEKLETDLTVLIPCYNRAKMIKEDLDKGLKLGNQPKMVVDDCSTQETQWLKEISRAFTASESKLIKAEKNGGVAESRRLGLEAIETKYTTFVDDDNVMACIDRALFDKDIVRLKDDTSVIVPRYVINYYSDKLSLGYDRQCYDGMNGEQVLKELASSGEMMLLLTGGAIGETQWMSEHSSCPLFRVNEDYLMLSRMMASKPEMKLRTTESLIFIRRFLEDGLTMNPTPLKMMLGLFSQAIACYYCLKLGAADKDEVLKWMTDRAALIQKLYGFGESFEAELIAYLNGKIDEETFVNYMALNGLKLEKGLDEIASELRKMRALFYIEPAEQKNHGLKAKNSEQLDSKEAINSYSDICKELYNVNLIESLSKSNKLFSVVIPTRNSAKYLRYTLMTCINQRFDDYEIVVSDNSTPGNDETFRLVKELDNKKIRYIRPEKELSLVKSFEFAYLNSEGEYIFGLGSDDALLFHSLDFLGKVLEKHNNEKVVLWNKLFYCWPGVSDKSQENLFFANRMYRNDKKADSLYLDSDTLLRQILNFDVSMYMLPMAYINSAIHRSVIKDFINKTGSFLGGLTQDVYTGLMNLALFDRILYIMHPIVIAGMSQNSIGFTSYTESNKQVISDVIRLREKFNEQYTNKYIPQKIKHDTRLLATEFLRIIDKKINNWDRSMINWKRFFAVWAESIKNNEDGFGEKLNDIRNTIKAHNDSELERWFDESYYYNRSFLEGKLNKIIYQKGFFSDENALRIDMSEFGIDNVYDVAKFFDNLYNLD